MSWKFGGIYIRPGFEDPVDALHFLRIDKRFTYETISFADAVKSTFEGTAIGTKNNVTLVQDNIFPYNSSYAADTYSDADHNLAELSNRAELLCFFLEGVTSSYGLNQFKNGKRTRRYAVMNGSLILKEGEFSDASSKQEPEKLIQWIEEFSGVNFNGLIKDTDFRMFVFTETGF